MSKPCGQCGGGGSVPRLVFGGRKPCPLCGGAGEVPDVLDRLADRFDQWVGDRMEFRGRDGGDFEAGDFVPGDVARDWALENSSLPDWPGEEVP